MSKYDDMINLPHHRSRTHPHMPVADRAAQFAPFAALTGYGEVLAETERLTEARPLPDEQQLADLDERFAQVLEKPGTFVRFICFVSDEKKDGGRYEEIGGKIRRVDEFAMEIILESGRRIPIPAIIGLEF